MDLPRGFESSSDTNNSFESVAPTLPSRATVNLPRLPTIIPKIKSSNNKIPKNSY